MNDEKPEITLYNKDSCVLKTADGNVWVRVDKHIYQQDLKAFTMASVQAIRSNSEMAYWNSEDVAALAIKDAIATLEALEKMK